MKKIFYASLLILAISCSNNKNDKQSGKPYDVLKETTYNKLQAKYESISDFDSGASIVMKNHRYGMINDKGTEILKCIYDTILPLENNYRITRLQSLYGLVNNKGKECIPNIYDDYIQCEKEGYFLFCKNKKWGFVSENGEILVQFKFDSFVSVRDSVYIAKINDKYGLYRFPDKIILDPIYDQIHYKLYGNDSDPSVAYLNNKIVVLNSQNVVVSKLEYSSPEYYIPYPQMGKYLEVAKQVPSENTTNRYGYGILNYETGKEVIPPIYERLGLISEGLIPAKMNDEYGYIDTTNKIIIPFKFESAYSFSEGMAMVNVIGGYYVMYGEKLPYYHTGFINKNGEFVIKPTFANQLFNTSHEFHEGLAAMGVKEKHSVYATKFGYIDKSGNFVIKPIYEEARSFNNGLAIVKFNDKYGCVNAKGEIVIETIYDDYVYSHPKDSIIIFEKDNKRYVFKTNGDPLLSQ